MAQQYHPKFVPDEDKDKDKKYHPKFIPDAKTKEEDKLESADSAFTDSSRTELKRSYLGSPERSVLGYRSPETGEVGTPSTAPMFQNLQKFTESIPEGANPNQDPDLAFGNIASKATGQIPGMIADTITDPYVIATGPFARLPRAIQAFKDARTANAARGVARDIFSYADMGRAEPKQKLLTAGPRFYGTEAGAADVSATGTNPLRRSTEVPYRAPTDIDVAAERFKAGIPPNKIDVTGKGSNIVTKGNLTRLALPEIQKALPSPETPTPTITKPPELPVRNPTAVFKGWQQTGLDDMPDFALYDIQGGERSGSTVDANELNKLGIKVPETPANPNAPLGVKKPEVKPFKNPFKKTAKPGVSLEGVPTLEPVSSDIKLINEKGKLSLNDLNNDPEKIKNYAKYLRGEITIEQPITPDQMSDKEIALRLNKAENNITQDYDIATGDKTLDEIDKKFGGQTSEPEKVVGSSSTTKLESTAPLTRADVIKTLEMDPGEAVRKGLVERVPHPTDPGQFGGFKLTDKGNQIAAPAEEKVESAPTEKPKTSPTGGEVLRASKPVVISRRVHDLLGLDDKLRMPDVKRYFNGSKVELSGDQNQIDAIVNEIGDRAGIGSTPDDMAGQHTPADRTALKTTYNRLKGQPKKQLSVKEPPSEADDLPIRKPEFQRDIESTPEEESQASKEPQFARTASGGIKIDVNVANAARELTSGYSNPLEAVMTREGLQNAIDAVKHLIENGKISVRLHKNGLEIIDNGSGMSREELETVFSNLHESGKTDDPNSTGGKGIGKATYMLGGKHFKVETVKLINGQKIKTTMEGTPEQLMSEVHPVEEKVSSTTSVGTKIQTKFTDEQDYINARVMLRDVLKHSRGVKSGISHNLDVAEPPVDDFGPVTKPASFHPGGDKVIGNKNIMGNDVKVIMPDTKLEPRDEIKVRYLNNGMYQFTRNHYLGDTVPNMPEELIVDVKPTAKEGSKEYPFPTQRESLKDDVHRDIAHFIDEKLVLPEKEGKKSKTQELYDSMTRFPLPNTTRKTVLFDPGNRLTPDELLEFQTSPAINDYMEIIDGVIDDILKSGGYSKWADQLEGVGIGLLPDHIHGMWVPNPATGKSTIVLNMFPNIQRRTPRDAAFEAVITLMHEVGHIGADAAFEFKPIRTSEIEDPRNGKYLEGYLKEVAQQGGLNAGHGIAFIKRLGNIFATFGAKRAFKGVDQIEEVTTRGSGATREYNPEIQKLLQIYQDSRGRDATTEDFLSGTGIKQATPTGGGGSSKGGNKADGNGPSSSVITRLRNSIDLGIEKAKEQAASYTEEKADRLAAIRGVRTKGLEGYYQRLSKLKGDYSKIGGLPPLSDMLSPKDIGALVDVIQDSPATNDQFAKIHATSGLVKLLNGEVPQPSELNQLNAILGYTVKQERKVATPLGQNTPPFRQSHGESVSFPNKPEAPKETRGYVSSEFGSSSGGMKYKGEAEDIFKTYREHLEKYNLETKGPSMARKIYEITRGLASVDVPYMSSAAFRQGIGLVGTKRWAQAFEAQARSFGDEKVYNEIMKGVNSSPIHRQRPVFDEPKGRVIVRSIADELGLASSDLKVLTQREEQIRSTLPEKIPVYGKYIRASNRSYTAMLNVLRTRTAEDWLAANDSFDTTGNIKPEKMEDARKLINTINELTGHASLKFNEPFSSITGSKRTYDLGPFADAISTVFFSPRNFVRDARALNPANYLRADKNARKKYLYGMLRRAGVWAGFTGLAALGVFGKDVTVEHNPLSSDFGKIKYKNTRFDAGTGLLQFITLLSRQAYGASKSTATGKTTEFGSSIIAPTREDSIKEFMQNRFHPTLGYAANALSATSKAPFYPATDAASRLMHMYVTDLIDVAADDPDAKQIIMGLAGAALSMGTQTYGPRDYGKPPIDIPKIGKRFGLDLPKEPSFKGGKLIGPPIRRANPRGFRLR